ncbi:hypothetical protein UF75_5344 [Desulfosporosinus sp. I2]|nr:hypothetical protein UF75_5344 [Desulfosporosinus sp. I2]
MRLGLLYGNTLVGFSGFAMGYLPYTLFRKPMKLGLSQRS